jgi:redox-sensitive bicupin YhaK (pirin superfamily)
MILVRPAEERGQTQLDWLDSRHSFSFGDYHDTSFTGFRGLRVINDDRVAPGAGFGAHPHRDMEIVTYVLEGALAHKDNLGNGSVIRAGDVQAMSAGTGIMHSEDNPSKIEPAHFLQIWIMPRQRGVAPAYHQRTLSKSAGWTLVVSGDGRDGSLKIHHDADLHLGSLEPGRALLFELRPKRHAWIQVVRGRISVNGKNLREGDGAAVSQETHLEFRADEAAEAMLFDLN